MSEKIEAFKNELVALCEKHQVQLTIDANYSKKALFLLDISTSFNEKQSEAPKTLSEARFYTPASGYVMTEFIAGLDGDGQLGYKIICKQPK